MRSEIEDKIARAFCSYPIRSYPKGQVIIFPDENPKHLLYLKSGKVRKYNINYRGNEVAVNIMKPPSCLPMVWVISRTPNRFFFRAETDCKIHVVPIDEALQFIKSQPDVLFEMLSRIYGLVDRLQGRMVELMAGNAQSRLLYELSVECRRFSKPDKENNYPLDVTESDIAARSGLSRETVSRELQKLHERGFIIIKRRTIIVTDLKAIEKKLGIKLSRYSLI